MPTLLHGHWALGGGVYKKDDGDRDIIPGIETRTGPLSGVHRRAEGKM